MEKSTTMGRPAKDKKGQTMFIPADCLEEVKAVIERSRVARNALATDKLKQRVARDTERLKALLPDDKTNQQLTSFGVPTPKPEPELMPEYLTPTPETPITGFKQAEWVEPPPIQAANGYDGTTKLQDALEQLYNKKISSNQNAALTNEAVTALGIVRGVDSAGRPSLIKDAPTRKAIYQWHFDKVKAGAD